MKIKVSNKSSGLILEDGKEIHFWLPKMDKSDSPPPNSAWFVLCLVQLLGKYDQRLNDLITEVIINHKYPLVTALVLSILIDFVAGGYLF